MFRFEKRLIDLAPKVNWVAGGAVVAMMLLTTADVIMRAFRHPIPGAYEMVGLLGSLAVSFSLAYTSIEKGHIAVEFIVNRFSAAGQALINSVNALIASILFAVITWRCFLYGFDFYLKGEVSMTLQMPIYPFVFGVAIGCGLLSAVLLIEFFEAIKKFFAYKNNL